MDLPPVNGAIAVLEASILEAQEEDEVMGLVNGHLGARLMGMLEDGDDLLDDDDGDNWEAVEVDLPGYRNMGDPSFRRHFRLSKPTFEILLQTLAKFMLDNGKVVRIRNSIDIPLLMVLWILANPDTFRSVALRFGVRPGVVWYHYSYIIETLREMGPSYIQWPSEAERARIKARFHAYSGISGVVGVIDGSFNNVTAPIYQKNRYRNRHHQYAYNSMVVCDDNLLIRDLHIGEVGAMHDSRVFRRSPLYRRLLNDDNNELLRPDEHLIGDKAYTLTNFMMTPFRNLNNLNPQQRAFNYALCKSRVRIEHCFGKAFMQWRRMKMLHSLNSEIAVDHFTACFVLHNFMILNGETLIDLDDPTATFVMDEEEEEEAENEGNEEEEENEEDEGYPNVNMRALLNRAKRLGRQKRTDFVNQIAAAAQ